MARRKARTGRTPEVYGRLLEAFRLRPGNIAFACDHARCSRSFAKKAWEDGWDEEWAPPLKHMCRSREQEDAAVHQAVEAVSGKETREDLRQRTYDGVVVSRVLEAYEGNQVVDPEAVRRDVATVRIVDTLAARHAMRGGALLVEQVGRAMEAAFPLVEAIPGIIQQKLEEGKLTPHGAVDLLERLAKLYGTALESYGRARVVAEECLGSRAGDGQEGPEMSVAECIQVVRAASEAAERAYSKSKQGRGLTDRAKERGEGSGERG